MVYGYRKLAVDLRDQGARISGNRVARLASPVGIAAQIGNKRRPGGSGGKPAIVAENRLAQRFQTSAPDQVWVTPLGRIGFANSPAGQWTSPNSEPLKAGCISAS